MAKHQACTCGGPWCHGKVHVRKVDEVLPDFNDSVGPQQSRSLALADVSLSCHGLKSGSLLAQLRGLELRGHSRLRELPAYLADLPALERLDISFCRSLAPGRLGTLTRLRVLSLQVCHV